MDPTCLPGCTTRQPRATRPLTLAPPVQHWQRLVPRLSLSRSQSSGVMNSGRTITTGGVGQTGDLGALGAAVSPRTRRSSSPPGRQAEVPSLQHLISRAQPVALQAPADPPGPGREGQDPAARPSSSPGEAPGKPASLPLAPPPVQQQQQQQQQPGSAPAGPAEPPAMPDQPQTPQAGYASEAPGVAPAAAEQASSAEQQAAEAAVAAAPAAGPAAADGRGQLQHEQDQDLSILSDQHGLLLQLPQHGSLAMPDLPSHSVSDAMPLSALLQEVLDAPPHESETRSLPAAAGQAVGMQPGRTGALDPACQPSDDPSAGQPPRLAEGHAGLPGMDEQTSAALELPPAEVMHLASRTMMLHQHSHQGCKACRVIELSSAS